MIISIDHYLLIQKNIISIISLASEFNNKLNFNTILFKDNDIIDILNEKILRNDYNLSFIENIVFNEIFINNNLNNILKKIKAKGL